ncbi:archaellin/type IV pilin N-terminal domain-containing protein [Cuniculiplasma sp. SKW3]|uniref:archaellin/type IV pilin N-terminal domain-containing protein n=1 Tax=Cuniculiplasma sp. SKW3 TaxID=3400170 RepID=UPI003FD62125
MKQVINKEDKAVSPIIATILLIAITVVLAATLVTILGGFTHGAGNTVESAGVTTSTSSNGSAIIVSVSSSSQALSGSQIQFTLTVTDANGTFTFTGNLNQSSAIVASSVKGDINITEISHTSTSFTGGTTYTFAVGYESVHHPTFVGSVISSYSLSLVYKGTQFYSSGAQTV